MATPIVIVDQLKDWQPEFPQVTLVTAKDYLSQPTYLKSRDYRVINLCRSYRYLSSGYFCSMLAEPRHHKVIPSVKTLTHLNSKPIYALDVEDLDEAIQRSLKTRKSNPGESLELHIFFGRCVDPALQDLARQIFDVFRCPLLKVEFGYAGKWHIERVRPLHLNGWLTPEEKALFATALQDYIGKPWRKPRPRSQLRYDLAILHNPSELQPPSNAQALKKFIRIGKKLGVEVDLIEKKDYVRLAEYDGLFIRETTKVDHHTYRFAKKAQSEGMAVIDDPDSILKCSNKIYLAELLAANHIPAPRTRILCKGSVEPLPDDIGFPVVLKIPDGAFSRGVVKANDPDEFRRHCETLFRETYLILAQEFLYTPFDWRIGILHGQPLYACQYFMSRKHWQVVKRSDSGRTEEGGFKTWPIDAVPKPVLDAAVDLARLIGDSLYGVDIKQTEHGVFIIEINDNPNIDAGIEDNVLGDRLYEAILSELVRRMEAARTA
ncbi:RimK family protein [Methylococcus sp. EFPC2]|uniref:RimK family protein n=1 Tax=Methylococcus sp. EFPC2 TaxID=2812648 RepID=UPI001968A118|nr:RimK family protein [Methylococcus sp. EFPC2]QSA98519.1 RimK family protein [Methylococcus sp. EFPC2]